MTGDTDLQDIAYTELLMKETDDEMVSRESADGCPEFEKLLTQLEEAYFRRRLVNVEYFKLVKDLLKTL